jgi:ribosomal protein L21E
VKKILRIAHQTFPNQPWDRHLAKGLFNLRRRQNAVTGQTPSHLLLGFDLRAPGEWEWDRGPIPDTAEERHQRARSHQRRYQTFQAGDRVLVRHHARRGFELRWIGPVGVIANARGDCYLVERGAYATREHIDHLRPAPLQTPAEPVQDAPAIEPQPDREDTPTLEQQPEEEDVPAGPTIVGQLLPHQPIPTQEELRRHRRRHLARQRVRENREEMPQEFRPPPESIWMANRSESTVHQVQASSCHSGTSRPSDPEPRGNMCRLGGCVFSPRLSSVSFKKTYQCESPSFGYRRNI